MRQFAIDRIILDISIWVLFLGGLFGLGSSLIKFFSGTAPVEYGVLGIGGGFWLLSAAITIFIREKLRADAGR